MLKKPVESERVRGSVRAVSSFSRPSSGRTPTVMAPPAPGVDEGLEQRENGVEAGPVRVYSSGSNKRPAPLGATPERRKLHLKIAIVTGLVGFLIAAAALTLPELLFGGSVTGGHRNTTYFGGGSKSTQDKSKSNDGTTNDPTKDSTDQQDQQPDSTSPSGQDQTTPPSGDSTAPDTQQTTPPPSQNTAPAPSPAPPQSPAPSAPAP
jgi:hypothetical protein